MAAFLIEVIFARIDLTDETVLDKLADLGIAGAEPLHGGRVVLSAVVDDGSAVDSAQLFVDEVVAHIPEAAPESAYRDLVSTSDIAERIGVTREAVRHWSAGRRREGAFPPPVGVPGGSKIWEWSSIHAWLRHNLGIWDGLDMPSRLEFSEIDGWIHRFKESTLRAQHADLELWLTTQVSAKTRVKLAPRRQASDTPREGYRVASRASAPLAAAAA